MERLIYVMLLSSLLGLSACTPKLYPVMDAKAYNHTLTDTLMPDSSMTDWLRGYTNHLDERMNEPLGFNAQDLPKEGLNSPLGSWMADILYAKGKEYYSKAAIDFALYNRGGIRIDLLPKGKISRRHIYELAPFDNTMVCLTLTGNEVKQLLNHMMQKGGWPISDGLQFVWTKERLSQVQIQGREWQAQNTYRVVTLDYLAHGGDDCSFLQDKPMDDSGILVRDIIINHIKHLPNGIQYQVPQRILVP